MKRMLSWILIILILAQGIVVSASTETEEGYFSLTELANGEELILNTPVFENGILSITGVYGDFAGRTVTMRAVLDEGSSLYTLDECETTYGGSFVATVDIAPALWNKPITIYLNGTKNADNAFVKGVIVSSEIDAYTGYVKELKQLLEQCKERNLAVDYETVNVSVVEEFIGLLRLDKETENLERYQYNSRILKKLYDETRTTLLDYLSGDKVPMQVPRYVTGPQTIDGNKMLAQVNDNGTIKTTPMHYLGYVYWGAQVEEVIDFSKFGANILHMDIGVSQVIVKPSNIAQWNARPDDPWGKYTYDITSVSGEHSEGSRSASCTASGEGYMLLSQTVEVEPNTVYEFGADIKNLGADGVWMEIGSQRVGKNSRYYFNDVCDWTTYTQTYRTKANETEITLTLGVTYNSQGTYFDNAFLRKSGSSANLLQNAGFETTCEVTEDYVINYEYIEKFKDFLRQAEAYDISVSLMSSSHYMPQFIYDLDATMKNTSPSYTTYMPFQPTHPLTLQVLGDYLDALIPEIADFDCINSFCMANEPRYYSNSNDYYLAAYRQKLKDDFGTVLAYNQAFGTYSFSFNYVSMPKDTDNMKLYNYWRDFNDSILEDWFAFMREKIKSHAPNLPVHAKVMQYILPSGDGKGGLAGANNYEKWTDIMDISGNDGWAYFGEEEYPIQAKMAWYDYLSSVNNAPIMNAEDHILQDGIAMEFSPQEGELEFNLTDIWQGALHGRTASMLWTWWPNKISYAKDSQFINTLLNTRADYVAAIGKTALDFQRLSSEITAINDSKKRVAILFSDHSMIGNQHYSSALYETYKTVTYSGERVKFVTESEPKTMNEEDVEILILPCSNYLKEDTINEIAKFVENGKKVIRISCGEEDYNQDGKALSDQAKGILNGITCLENFATVNGENVADTDGAVKNLIKAEIGKLDNMIHLESNCDIEWSWTEYDGKYLINLCNYGEADATISIKDKKGTVYAAKDLINNTELDTTFVVKPNHPMLLQVSIQAYHTEFFSKGNDNTWISAQQLVSGELMIQTESLCAKPNEDILSFVALYKGDEMLQCVADEKKADANGVISFETMIDIPAGTVLDDYTVKVFLWNKTELKPLNPASSLKRGD